MKRMGMMLMIFFVILGAKYGDSATLVGECKTLSAQGVAVSGKYACIADGGGGLSIIDVANPKTPQVIGTYSTPGYAFDVRVAGNYAYVADRDTGLLIIDVSNPQKPALVGKCDTPGFAVSVRVMDSYAYVADSANGLVIIDVSSPTNPRLISSCNTPGSALDVTVTISGTKRYTYVAEGLRGVQIIDVTDPNNPLPIGNYSTSKHVSCVKAKEGKYAYITDDDGLQILDVSNPSQMSLIGQYKIKNATRCLISGKYAYLTNGASGLKILDISDPKSPMVVDTYSNLNYATDVCICGNYAYVTDLVMGLLTIDVSVWTNTIESTEFGSMADTGMEFGEEPGFSIVPSESVVSKGIGEITVIPSTLTITSIMTDGQTYHRLSIADDGGLTSEIGKPELPVIGTYVEIPDGVELDIQVTGTYTLLSGEYNVYPVQMPLIDTYEEDVNRGEGEIGTINSTFYATTDKFYPEQIVSAGEPTILRGHRITSLVVYPVQYNPVTKQIRRWTRIRASVQYARGIEAEILGIDPRLEDPGFETLCDDFCLNYKKPATYIHRDNECKIEAPVSGAEYLIITHDDFYNAILPLAEWKRKKGLRVEVVKTSEIRQSGPTSVDIQNYVKNAYTTWKPAPVYLLLVGDVDRIPTNYKNDHFYHNSKIGTDLYYATMYEGTGREVDYSPDLFVGRLCVKTAAEAQAVVNKVLTYEKNPGAGDTGWLKKMLFAAYCQDDATGHDERFFLQTAETARSFMSRKNYECLTAYTPAIPANSYTYCYGTAIPDNVVREFVSDSAANTKIINALNDGCLIALHRDHGNSRNWQGSGKEGWVHPSFDIGDVDRLSNGAKLPVIFSLNCMSGWFDGETDAHSPNYESLGERMLKEPNKGCIGFIGATRVSLSGYNDELCKGLFDAIWQDFNPNYPSPDAAPTPKLGQVLNYGKLYMYNSRVKTKEVTYPWRPSEEDTLITFDEFNLQGDPELAVWTETPRSFSNISCPHQILTGETASVTVTTGVPDAYVCLLKGDEVHNGTKTDSSGTARLNIQTATSGEMFLTVTKHNYLPYEGTITVIARDNVATSSSTGTSTSGTGTSLAGTLTSQPDPCLYSQWDAANPVWGDNPDIDLIMGVEDVATISATIYNRGTVAANNTMVSFRWAAPGIGQQENLIGTTTVDVPANGTVSAVMGWILPQEVLSGISRAIIVEVSHPQDSNLNNNKGVECYSSNYVVGTQNIQIPISIRNTTNVTAKPSLEISSLSGWETTTLVPTAPFLPGGTGTAILVVTLPSGITFEVGSFNLTARIGGQILGGMGLDVMVDNIPALSWVGTEGFTSDGFEPRGGDAFEFKVKYSDRDNNSPVSGYPRLHVLLDDKEIQGSPFVMTAENIADIDYRDGKDYRTSVALPNQGSYVYYFEAKDTHGFSGTGTPSMEMAGPVVNVSEGIPVRLTTPAILSAGSEFWAEVSVGSSTQNLLGMSCRLRYAGAIEPVSNGVRQGDLFGQEAIFVSTLDRGSQTIGIACSRRGSSSVGTSSHRILTKIRFMIPAGAVHGATAMLTITDIQFSTPDGQTIRGISTPASMVVERIPLAPVVISPQSLSSEFWADIRVGTVSDLYALSLDMKINPQAITVPDPTTAFLSGELMGSQQVLMPMGEVNNQTGSLSVHITRMGDVPGVNGPGNVLRIRFGVAANAGTATVLIITKAVGYDSKGGIIGLTPEAAVLQINTGGISVWPGDTNNDGIVNEHDILPIGLHWQRTGPVRQDATIEWRPQSALAWIPPMAVYADANGDGVVNGMEILAIGRNWGKTHAVTTASMSPMLFSDTTDHTQYVEAYKAMYEILEGAEETEGVKILRDTLQRLIIKAAQPIIPDQDELLQNYPNPFNPECWLPFTLSKQAQVVIRIYNISGQLIRTLDLGLKEPGRYISRDRAAHWDGFNDCGDEAASGVYFYQIHAGDYVSTKQMVVLK